MPPARAQMIAGLPVLFVMAAKAEYGPCLRQRINPLMSGIGPVESAVRVTAALSEMEERPELIVSLGSAGSSRLTLASVYQVSAVSYRDMDATPLGFECGCTPSVDLPALVELPHHIPGLAKATLATGASIVSGAAYQDISADMVDMETFAILRSTQHFGIPLIGLRGISDGAEDLHDLSDWTRYLHVIDKKLAPALDILETALSDRTLLGFS